MREGERIYSLRVEGYKAATVDIHGWSGWNTGLGNNSRIGDVGTRKECHNLSKIATGSH